jgi:hypothetical protein
MACSCSNGSDYIGPRLEGYGYKPQAGSPGIAPHTWRLPTVYPARMGNYPHSPLGLLPHEDEQRALEMVRRRLSGGAFGALTTDAQRDPHVAGMIRALQTRVASVAASQHGALTPTQTAQVKQVHRAIKRRQGMGDYVPMNFVLPTPLDTGTTVQDVAAQNFPLFTNGATAGTGQTATPAPAPAPSTPSFLVIAIAAVAGWWFWGQMTKEAKKEKIRLP